jgi:hypothetical protein
MAFPDDRGNPCGSTDATARAAVERALWRMMSFYGTPLDDLDCAMGADPGWALPHAMKAGFLLSLTEPALLDEADAHLAHARALSVRSPARERAHLQALQCVREGRWQAASRSWDDLLLQHPRDALALQWAHLWDFYRGDAPALRQRPARALPEWDTQDRLYPFVLGLLAFGLEENHQYPQAEEAGRRALASDPAVPWAIHAVAHVMEMQGRFEDGSAWLRQTQPYWAAPGEGAESLGGCEPCGFAPHLWWHKGLFRLEAMDTPGALRLVDTHLSGSALQVGLQRVDAAALLWRLHLLGEDVQARCSALLAGWPLADSQAGHYAFNDVHVVLAMLGCGEVARAEGWLARCAARAMQPEDARRTNHAMAREVGLPLVRGLLALARGDADTALRLMWPARARAPQLGGSHAQRDLIDQTLLAAATQAGDAGRRMGRALLNERCLDKAATPLTRHWAELLAPPAAASA